MTKHSSKTQRSGKKQKVEKLEFVQDFLPIKNLSNGIIETVAQIFYREKILNKLKLFDFLLFSASLCF